MTANELKPCPFCGSKDLRIQEPGEYNYIRYFVVCKNADCGAEGPCDLGESGAIAKWNAAKRNEATP